MGVAAKAPGVGSEPHIGLLGHPDGYGGGWSGGVETKPGRGGEEVKKLLLGGDLFSLINLDKFLFWATMKSSETAVLDERQKALSLCVAFATRLASFSVRGLGHSYLLLQKYLTEISYNSLELVSPKGG